MRPIMTRGKLLAVAAVRLAQATGVLVALIFAFLALPAQAQVPSITAAPNPALAPAGQTSGTTTLSWDGGGDHPYAEVWQQVDNNDETFVVESGKGTRQMTVEVGKTYTFKLSDAGEILASVTVTAKNEPVPALKPLGGGGAAADDDEATKDCQVYSRITLLQVDIAIGKKNGGTGDGCSGAEGPRWSNDKAAHFNWCTDEATPEQLASELKARHNLLLDCTAKRGKKKWNTWDNKSADTFSGILNLWPPDEYGKGKCEGEGNIILKAVKAVQKDPSVLFDDTKDKFFYNSRYYHHFQHWLDIRCVLTMSTPHTRAYTLEGYTGVGVETKPRGGPIVAPGPIQGTELEKGPIIAKPDESAPPPDQAKEPYVPKRRTGPFTQQLPSRGDMAPTEAMPVAGANSCGDYVNRAPSTVSASSMSDLREAMICLINAERATRQLPALTPISTLYNSAQGHADAAQQLKWWTKGADPHVNPETGSTIDSRIKAAGYCGGNPNRTGEIAYTWAGDQATPIGAVNWWMNISTSGHREAILDASIKEIGVGIGGQVADKSLQPQTDMGTYVVNSGTCASKTPAPQAEGSPADTKVPTDTIVKPDSGGLFQEKLKYRDRILKSP